MNAWRMSASLILCLKADILNSIFMALPYWTKGKNALILRDISAEKDSHPCHRCVKWILVKRVNRWRKAFMSP